MPLMPPEPAGMLLLLLMPDRSRHIGPLVSKLSPAYVRSAECMARSRVHA